MPAAKSQGGAAEAADRLSRYRGLEGGRQLERRRRTLGIPNRAPHPNAAKCSSTGFFRAKVQTALQKLGRRRAQLAPPNDIAKDDVDAFNRLSKEKIFRFAKPEYQDLDADFQTRQRVLPQK